jgi:hypothetical protein
LLADGVEEFVPGRLEFLDALGFQDLEDVDEVDAEGFQAGEHGGGLGVGAVDGVAADDTVVADRVDGLLGGGVDGVGGDEFDDVAGVVVLGVLDAGGGAKWALGVGAGRLEGPPAVTGESLLVGPVGQPGIGDRGLAFEGGGLRGA